ncbi:MAG: right-handed parallel beta-helix repeat-containing protein [Candidatus Bathyarchaeia archaeon]
MKRTAIVLIFIVALLFSALLGICFVRDAYANFALVPEEPPVGYTINSDGTFTGENIRRDGNTYIFTGDINCTIVILRDGIVLDGAGYTLHGNGESAGIWIQERSNIVIKNLHISGFQVGVKFSPNLYSSGINENCSILDSIITNNTYGLSITESSNCYIAGNYIARNTYGAGLYSSVILRNNRFEQNNYNVVDSGYCDNDIDSSNTINGKPIYYWVNRHNLTVPTNAALVVLKNCSGIKVENLSLQGNENGLLLYNTNYSTISGNTLANNLNGIVVRHAFNNVITNNHITSNQNAGIEQYEGSGNLILGNRITANAYGIVCSDTMNNVISNNQVIANKGIGVNIKSNCKNFTISHNFISENIGDGIFISDINGSAIIGNNITLNTGCGVSFGYGPNGVIKGNYIAKNKMGIWTSNAFENTIIANTILKNAEWGIRLEGSQHDNIIHHNNFVDNNNGGIQAAITELWVYPDLFKQLPPGQTPRPPQLVAGAANMWDDGAEGNYWSDYTTRYPAAQASGNSKIGDTPYYINENNQDNHPLLAPHEISLEIYSTVPSSIQPLQEQDTAEASTTEPKSFPIVAAAAATALIAFAVAVFLVYSGKCNYASERP